ncbi:Na+/H+ antiporter subunit E [Patulibacter brassicae]|jgi:multicomponent Na+:H+ antiporter subunit E|uniref:Na+/H+ antiporter subunit E n=1 Tax=Patulibacter brassicae TaxID=1705717 RepID=A0ABU4VJH5_9ACTN|nr:Na+/H+ antiporter subunit E [Patulibacter brassicae]MDX8151977.1 Na+/H+ antiporter subunit E [Patulibacter brassicae]
MPTPIRRLRRRVAGAWLLQPVTAVWLVVLWLLLWGRFSTGLALSGIVVALVVVRLFPLQPIPVEGRIRPLAALRLWARFAWDVVVASVQVAWLAVRAAGGGDPPGMAVIAVPLRTRSELLLTAVAEILGLVPGSIVVEIDRTSGILYVHLIGVDDHAAVERERERARALEARVIRAFGSDEDRAALAAEDPTHVAVREGRA